MLAAMLDYPFASLVTSIEVLDGKKLKISREIAGGNREMNEIDLPCVLSIQTGINEPRYVGMRGIRQVASVPIPTFDASELGVDPGSVGESAAKVKRVDYFVPALGKGAEMLQGSREENVAKVLELVAAKGGL
jgi:electron transfer flavoprotein beta subunit